MRPIGEDTSTGHTSELAVVRGLLDRTLVRQTSHLLTIVSEVDGAMSSFLAELQQTVSGDVLVLAGCATADWPLGAATAVLAGLCGVTPDDDPATVSGRLAATLERCRLLGSHAKDPTIRLLPLLTSRRAANQPDSASTLPDWQQVLMRAARGQPLVVLVRDAHLADPQMLDALESMADLAHDVPMLVVVATGPELMRLRLILSGGQHSASGPGR